METSSWGQQREQSVGWVAGVFENPPGFSCTPPCVDVLEGGKLTSNNVAGSSHDPLQSFAVASGAVSKPGGDAAGQDALHRAGVEGSEDAWARSKFPQPSQEEEALMCRLQHCVWVSRPYEILGDVNAEELKAVYPCSTGVLLMVMGVCSVLCLLKSTTSSLVLSMLSERWFSWHHLFRVLTSSSL